MRLALIFTMKPEILLLTNTPEVHKSLIAFRLRSFQTETVIRIPKQASQPFIDLANILALSPRGTENAK